MLRTLRKKIGEVAKFGLRRRSRKAVPDNLGTWVRIPPSPPAKTEASTGKSIIKVYGGMRTFPGKGKRFGDWREAEGAKRTSTSHPFQRKLEKRVIGIEIGVKVIRKRVGEVAELA